MAWGRTFFVTTPVVGPLVSNEDDCIQDPEYRDLIQTEPKAQQSGQFLLFAIYRAAVSLVYIKRPRLTFRTEAKLSTEH